MPHSSPSWPQLLVQVRVLQQQVAGWVLPAAAARLQDRTQEAGRALVCWCQQQQQQLQQLQKQRQTASSWAAATQQGT
jgi:hypothetical protein